MLKIILISFITVVMPIKAVLAGDFDFTCNQSIYKVLLDVGTQNTADGANAIAELGLAKNSTGEMVVVDSGGAGAPTSRLQSTFLFNKDKRKICELFKEICYRAVPPSDKSPGVQFVAETFHQDISAPVLKLDYSTGKMEAWSYNDPRINPKKVKVFNRFRENKFGNWDNPTTDLEKVGPMDSDDWKMAARLTANKISVLNEKFSNQCKKVKLSRRNEYFEMDAINFCKKSASKVLEKNDPFFSKLDALATSIKGCTVKNDDDEYSHSDKATMGK